jgi:hypothetical protein
MEKSEAMEQLSQKFKGLDWFHSVGLDQYGRIVVYAHWINSEIYKLVPDNVEKFQILLHFAGSLTAKREQFVDTPQAAGSTLKPFEPKVFVEAAKAAQANGIDTGFGAMLDEGELDQIVSGGVEENKSLLHLQNELTRLEKACGSYTLQDIFYEIQDGKNAVTNLSSRYPEVHAAMKKLFDEYGFDVIYEELDG